RILLLVAVRARRLALRAADPLGREVARRVRIGRAAGDRVTLVLVRVVDLLAFDLDAAVLVVTKGRWAEFLLRALVVPVVALRTAKCLVLAGALGPVLELLRRVALLELLDLVLRLVALGSLRAALLVAAVATLFAHVASRRC